MSDDDLYFGEQGPTELEFHLTGVFGMLVFSLVLVLAFRGFLMASDAHTHLRFFFLAVFLTAACELPRYFVFTIQGTYTSQVAYALHMLAGLFYFFALSIVCYMWSCIVNLGAIASLLYSKKGLVVANIFLGSILLFACVACLRSSSLSSFFHSDLFILFVAQEIVQSMLYTAGLALYGVSMILKLRRAQGLIGEAARDEGGGGGAEEEPSDGHREESALCKLQRLLQRITITLGFTSLSTLLRLVMCCLQISSSKTDFSVSNDVFTHYGVVWFSLAEFIPRGGSSLALLLFMSKRSHQASRKEIRKRYLGSEDGRVTLSSLSSAKIISSGLEHSSMSSVNGTLLDNERESMLFRSYKNSMHDPLKEGLTDNMSFYRSRSSDMVDCDNSRHE